MNMEPRLKFPNEFFQAETREDFLVDAAMKTVWAAEMELLSDIDAVCKKYNLQYFAYWGTLLGAVRHKGYVPWDDDMDLAMKREDYNILMKVLPKELPETYRVYSPLTELGYDRFWACVTNADTISIEPERLKKFHNCPFWVGIDIVPLDYMPRNKNDAELLLSFLTLIWRGVTISKLDKKTKKDAKDLKETVQFLEKNLNTKFDRDKPLINQLMRLGNMLASSYTKEDGDFLTLWTTNVRNNGKFLYPKEWWADAVEMPYEVMSVPVPVGYDNVLKAIYGDYNVRVRGEADHDYPYYKAQIQQLRDKVKEMEEQVGN